MRAGQGRALVVRGEAGVGKTALFEYASGLASDLTILRAVGAEAEMELAYASLHQLCGPLLGRLELLPAPQRQALETVFGLSSGTAPDRFMVGLAVLSLLSEASAERPVLCVVDDAQWLDQSSALTLAFVARRLLAEPVGVIVGVRDDAEVFRHLPDLEVLGLSNGDARALLGSAVRFPMNSALVDRIVAETRGNPLALLELPRGLSGAELAGFGPGEISATHSALEETFRRRITALPEPSARLLLIAAAEPLGEPALMWRAAALQGIAPEAAAPAAEAGLCEFGPRVRFRHPLVRAAAYGAGSPDDRRWAHAALAEATDADADPDRSAWHRARACAGLDDAVADELERSAARARARGGSIAAAAFLERAADLTLDPVRRAERALAAAEALHLAGSREDALRLAAAAERGTLDELGRARLDRLRGQMALSQRRGADAAALLLSAAQRLEPFDHRLARDAYRDAFMAATFANTPAEGGLTDLALAIREAVASAEPVGPVDELLAAGALLLDSGWETGAPIVQRALERLLPVPDELDLPWLAFAARMASWVWDSATWDTLTSRTLEQVREAGAFALLPMAALIRCASVLAAGEFDAAAACIAEQEAVEEDMGGARMSGARIMLAAFRGHEAEVKALDRTATPAATARGDGRWMQLRHCSFAVLWNGLGRYAEALTAAEQAVTFPGERLALHRALSELVEAAVRSGRPEAAREALRRLSESTSACRTDWADGVEARARALIEDSRGADELYRSAIDHLGRARLRSELARTQLLYGEWLRREGRRVDARTQLRAAHDMLAAIGMEAFAERARKELAATGERVRQRSAETRDDLTPQERQIALLARDGLSNVEIAGRLFLSPRTVEWHLSKVFNKLDVRSRLALSRALSGSDSDAVPA